MWTTFLAILMGGEWDEFPSSFYLSHVLADLVACGHMGAGNNILCNFTRQVQISKAD